MQSTLVGGLRQECPRLETESIHGFLQRYQPGGLRPARLLNLAWVYLRLPCHLVVRRPAALLVRSTPPGIQLWASWLGALFGIPVLCWLMDYHPELEARGCERRGFRVLAGILRWLDLSALRRLAGIVVLDGAMERLVRSRVPKVPVAVHPPWGAAAANGGRTRAYQAGSTLGVRRLAYAGNLGVAHPRGTLVRLFRALRRGGAVELHFIGTVGAAMQVLKREAEALQIAVFEHPPQPFELLGELFDRRQIDLGVVLLADEAAGVVSPCKYTGYIHHGLPTLYLGPPETNADAVVSRFGAGFALRNTSSGTDVEEMAARIWDAEQLQAAAARVCHAAAHFAQFNGRSLAAVFAQWLPVSGTMVTAAVDELSNRSSR